MVLLDDGVDVGGVEQRDALREPFGGDEDQAVGRGLPALPVDPLEPAEQAALRKPGPVVGVAGEHGDARGGTAHARAADVLLGEGVDERGLARARGPGDDDQRGGGAHADPGQHVVAQLREDLLLRLPGLLGSRQVEPEPQVGHGVPEGVQGGGERLRGRVGQVFLDDLPGYGGHRLIGNGVAGVVTRLLTA